LAIVSLLGAALLAAPASAFDQRLYQAAAGGPSASATIVGGYTPDPSQWPWMVSISYRGTNSHFCGGTLVQPTIVLTAGHCVFDGDQLEQNLQVTIGRRDLRQPGGEQIPVAAITPHPDYRPKNHPWDVAVLKLASASTAPLATFLDPTVVLPEGTRATVMGWGLTGPGEAPLSPTLLAADLPLWSGKRCAVAYQQRLHVPSAVCAGFMDGRIDSCPGDSGGPLMVPDKTGTWKLLGVVSYGPECGTPKVPGVYSWLNALPIRQFLAQFIPGIVTGAPGTVPRDARPPSVRVKLSSTTLRRGSRVRARVKLSEAARIRLGVFRVRGEQLVGVRDTLKVSGHRGVNRLVLSARTLGGLPSKGRYVVGTMATARGLDSALQYNAVHVH
jgi:hypothetical protein